MWKSAVAGVFALAIVGIAPASAENAAKGALALANIKKLDFLVSEAHIAQLRDMLKLRPDQQVHWPPVENALRDLVREQEREVEQVKQAVGLAKKLTTKVSAVTGEIAAIKRLVNAARPLLNALDDGQKREVAELARKAGLQHLAAAL